MSFTDSFTAPDDLGPLHASELHTSLSDSLAATAAQAVGDNPSMLWWRAFRNSLAGGDIGGFDATGMTPEALAQTQADLDQAKAVIPETPIGEARARVKAEGLESDVKLPEQASIKTPVLDLLLADAHERANRAAAIARGPHGFWPSALQFMTSVGVGMIDPINAAAFSIPVLGEARWGKLLADAGDSLFARAGVRGVQGVAQGAVGTAALQPAEWWWQTQDGRDYTMADAMRSIVWGAGLGAAFHAGGGLLGPFKGDISRKLRGLPLQGAAERPAEPFLPVAREATAAPGAEEVPGISPVPENAPAAVSGAQIEGRLLPEEALAPEGMVLGEVSPPQAPLHPAEVLADLPPAAREDAFRASVANLTADRPVRTAEMLQEAAKADPRIAESVEPYFEAYHGSPHDFDAFSAERIGSGEGVQAYGHGLYFAEEQAVADYYRGLATAGSPEEKYALRAVRDQGSIAAAIADLRDALKRNIELGRFDHVYRGALDVLERWQRDGKALPQGHLYRVRIAADPEHFLDWDKPLSDQSEAVQSALRSLGVDPATASLGEAFNVIGGERDRLVAEKLHAAGVPGIKYLDEGSRAGPELRVEPLGFGTDKFQLVDAQGRQVPGTFETRAAAEEALKRFRQTRNYVVFDDKLISITHKNGEPVRQAELPGRLHALSADARQWPALPEGARMVGHGDHGPILEGFRSWGDALSWLKAAQTGEVRGLLRHRDVPAPIDVVWGRATAKDAAGNVVQRGYGLAHIIADHPELDVARLPELLAQMREVPSPVRGRIRLESDRYGAALSPEWEGVRKHWVITAFGLRGKSGGKGEGGGPGGEPGPRPAADLQAPLSRYYGEEGAGPTESLESRAGADKPDWQSLAGAPEWRQFADAPAPYEDPQLVAESKEAEREPAPPAEPAQAVSAAEKAAQAADKILADMLPTLSDEERMQIDEALQQLDRDHEERGAIIKEGAACLAAAAA